MIPNHLLSESFQPVCAVSGPVVASQPQNYLNPNTFASAKKLDVTNPAVEVGEIV